MSSGDYPTVNGAVQMNASGMLRALALGGIVMLGAVLAGVGANAMPAAALQQGVAGLGAVAQVRHHGRPHRVHRRQARTRVYVYPGGYTYGPQPYDYYPAARGFEDYSPVRQGNI